MQHFSVDQLTDYVRDVAEDERKQAVSSHVEGGCESCERTVGLLQRVVSVADTDRNQAPPDFAVRSVKAYFSLQQPERAPHLSSSLGLRLAFDSLAGPAPVGTRGLDSTSRQLVYFGHDYTLTLKMEYRCGKVAAGMALGGEILRREEGPVSDVPTFLMSGRRVLGQSRSGKFGDFQINCTEERPLSLRLCVETDEHIEIDLDRPEDPVSAAIQF